MPIVPYLRSPTSSTVQAKNMMIVPFQQLARSSTTKNSISTDFNFKKMMMDSLLSQSSVKVSISSGLKKNDSKQFVFQIGDFINNYYNSTLYLANKNFNYNIQTNFPFGTNEGNDELINLRHRNIKRDTLSKRMDKSIKDRR